MSLKDPESGLYFDALPHYPRESHTAFRVVIADYLAPVIPPNALQVEPPGPPFPSVRDQGLTRRAGYAAPAMQPQIVVTIPWNRAGFTAAKAFWLHNRASLGEHACAHILSQLLAGEKELDRRDTLARVNDPPAATAPEPAPETEIA